MGNVTGDMKTIKKPNSSIWKKIHWMGLAINWVPQKKKTANLKTKQKKNDQSKGQTKKEIKKKKIKTKRKKKEQGESIK